MNSQLLWMREEARRQGLPLSEEDLQAIETSVSRVRQDVLRFRPAKTDDRLPSHQLVLPTERT